MSPHLPRVTITGREAAREIDLQDYLDANGREAAARESNAWIKSLRHASVDGAAFRDRFTYRGESLWWFAELYLHKMGAVTRWFETRHALEACLAREAPRALGVAQAVRAGDRTFLTLGPQVAGGRGVEWKGPPSPDVPVSERVAFASRCAYYTWSAHASRLRPGRGSLPVSRGGIAAFVHSAFWRTERQAGSASGEEGYIGPVLRELAETAGAADLTLVGVGPRTNFRARHVWDAWSPRVALAAGDLPFTPVELFSMARDIRPSLDVWHARKANLAALLQSDDVRGHARVGGCDVWGLLVPELAGVTALQFPWSARAMDEAGAVLDRLEPRAVVTYAEAGGWGRAIMLEARRRRVPSVGLQHGFIYRHWLNYLHEPDEMRASASNPAQAGFPHPSVTLLYDRYAQEHLLKAGHFPESSLAVTGSPRLDALVAGVARLGPEDLARTRAAVGAVEGQQVVLVASKYTQIAGVFPALVRAVSAMPDVRLVVKTHPAETPEPYDRAASGVGDVTVAPPSADLAALVAASRLVVTVNSTVAIDAMVLGVPSLVVDLPNNLSPFVEAGVMTGAGPHDDLAPLVRQALGDENARRTWADRRAAFLERYAIGSDGGAARRAADAIRRLKPDSDIGLRASVRALPEA